MTLHRKKPKMARALERQWKAAGDFAALMMRCWHKAVKP